jgi:hypothetical protein
VKDTRLLSLQLGRVVHWGQSLLTLKRQLGYNSFTIEIIVQISRLSQAFLLANFTILFIARSVSCESEVSNQRGYQSAQPEVDPGDDLLPA